MDTTEGDPRVPAPEKEAKMRSEKRDEIGRSSASGVSEVFRACLVASGIWAFYALVGLLG